MKAEDIIKKKVNPEGYAIPKKTLAQIALARIQARADTVFRVGDVVFTVATNPQRPVVHIYSVDNGSGFLRSCRKFMERVWKETTHNVLMAPISDKRVMKLAEKFGWKPAGKVASGHTIYLVERPQ